MDSKQKTNLGLHPLQPLSAEEILQAANIVKFAMEEEKFSLRFELIELNEPSKSLVRNFKEGQNFSRQARVNAYGMGQIGVFQFIVDLNSNSVKEKNLFPEARPMISVEEVLEIETVVKADERFIEACNKRGITELELVCIDPWSAGNFEVKGEEGKHVSHAFCWLRTRPHDNQYAHPIEGLNPVIDIKRMEVLRVDDYGVIPVPLSEANYDSEFQTQFRTDLKTIDIVQPNGVSFDLEGHKLQWLNWKLLIGFNAREGLTLHDISFGGRPICYRASLAEMVVPYGSPDNAHYRKNVFDIGEYGFGRLTNTLSLGCDCLGAIHYLDCWVSDIDGNPLKIKNGICIHEEDTGIIWKHFDGRSERTEVRRGRRLVISSIATVGNYDYGCYWYLYLDGTIEFEIKATGIINTVGCVPGTAQKYGTEVAPGVVGQMHQHLFCARLDMSIDGDNNAVFECDTQIEEQNDLNPYGNAYFVQETKLFTECGRTRSPDHERYWKFANSSKKNYLGQATAYKLEPTHSRRTFVKPTSPSGRRMAYTENHLWVTAYDPRELYPAGEFVNHSDGLDGLPAYVSKKRSIEDSDIVVWHVFGIHHLPRLEDYPVQPVATTGFKLVSSGFFDQNPTLDLPNETNFASRHAIE